MIYGNVHTSYADLYLFGDSKVVYTNISLNNSGYLKTHHGNVSTLLYIFHGEKSSSKHHDLYGYMMDYDLLMGYDGVYTAV